MEKRVMLITGASGGMGTAISKWFKEFDYQLVLHSFDHQPSLPTSEDVTHLNADLRDPAAIQEMVNEIIARYGRLDVVINNAGISRSAMSWKTSLDAWNETMAVNLNAPFIIASSTIPKMREKSFGRIINITSVVAQSGAVGTSAYAASKAGLIGLTKTISKEVALNGITVNALALGYFNTGMITDVPEEIQKTIVQSIPMNRLGTTDTVCKTIEWLISEEAGYITGQVINLNGGMQG
jgi:NAD(P)-dependent dehydrogenase (short-subunit alcohol dehydrogenase family)